MSTAEIVAYLVGADLRKNGLPPTKFLLMGLSTVEQQLTDEQFSSRVWLGPDVWASWVRRGYGDAVQWQG